MGESNFFSKKPDESRFKKFEEAVAEVQHLADQEAPNKADAKEAERAYQELMIRLGNAVMG